MSLSAENEKIVSQVAQKYNIPQSVWKPILLNESGGNPNARTFVPQSEALKKGQGAEDSRGLFQINIFAHPDANSVALYDPQYNSEYAFKNFIAPAYNEAVSKGLTGVEVTKYVERYGIRPKWTEQLSNKIEESYNEIENVSRETIEEKYSAGYTLTDVIKDPLGTLTKDLKSVQKYFRYSFINVLFFGLVVVGLYVALRNKDIEKTVVGAVSKIGKGD